jgi:hypothetical protein
VVAGKKMNDDSLVGQLGQFPEKPDEPSGNNGSVFEPEIEDIPHQVYFRCVAADLVEPSDNPFLPVKTFLVIRYTKMKVGCEIYFFC